MGIMNSTTNYFLSDDFRFVKVQNINKNTYKTNYAKPKRKQMNKQTNKLRNDNLICDTITRD